MQWKPVIKYPKFLAEFEIHAQLYCALSRENFNVRGCVPAVGFETGTQINRKGRILHKHPKVFLDLVVFSEYRQPVVIIECKSQGSYCGRQKLRYESFGLPIILCDRLSMIEEVVERVKKMVDCASVPEYCR